MVPPPRLELGHREALEPKSSVSTNSTRAAIQILSLPPIISGTDDIGETRRISGGA